MHAIHNLTEWLTEKEATDRLGRIVFGNTNRRNRTVFYHGTPSARLPGIAARGLLVSPPTRSGHGYNVEGQVSMSVSYDTAFYYGSLFAGTGNNVTVLELRIPTSFELDKGLQYDEWVSYTDIPRSMIAGARMNGRIVQLSALDPGSSHFDTGMMKDGRNLAYVSKSGIGPR